MHQEGNHFARWVRVGISELPKLYSKLVLICGMYAMNSQSPAEGPGIRFDKLRWKMPCSCLDGLPGWWRACNLLTSPWTSVFTYPTCLLTAVVVTQCYGINVCVSPSPPNSHAEILTFKGIVGGAFGRSLQREGGAFMGLVLLKKRPQRGVWVPRCLGGTFN